MFWLMIFSPLIIFTALGISGVFHSLNNASMTYTIAAFGIAQTLFVAAGVFYEAIFGVESIKGYSKTRKAFFWFPLLFLFAVLLLVWFVRIFV